MYFPPLAHHLDAELAGWLWELETDILARNADVGDVQHDSYIAVQCELMHTHPNMGYIRSLLSRALKKPFTAMH